jgi:hypothetical protein
MKLSFTVVRCGACGKPRGLAHVCVTRLDRKRKPGRTRVKPSLTARCGRCGKRMGNPLRHRCVTRTDFRRRKAAAAKARRDAARAARRREAATRPRHEYQACGDGDCQRAACQAWREGCEEGFAQGHAAGFAEGRAAS